MRQSKLKMRIVVARAPFICCECNNRGDKGLMVELDPRNLTGVRNPERPGGPIPATFYICRSCLGPEMCHQGLIDVMMDYFEEVTWMTPDRADVHRTFIRETLQSSRR